MYQRPKYVHIRIFRKCWSLILGCLFPVSILKHSSFLKTVKGNILAGTITFYWSQVFDRMKLKTKTKKSLKRGIAEDVIIPYHWVSPRKAILKPIKSKRIFFIYFREICLPGGINEHEKSLFSTSVHDELRSLN